MAKAKMAKAKAKAQAKMFNVANRRMYDKPLIHKIINNEINVTSIVALPGTYLIVDAVHAVTSVV